MTGEQVPGGGPELFRLVRYWSRRWAMRVADRAAGDVHVQHIQLVEAVDSVVVASGADATVAGVAHQLGVDRSVASRMISEAVTAGYVHRQPSPVDARRVGMRLTASGQELLAASREWQQATFDALVAHWSAADRRKLAQYLHRLAIEVIDQS